MPDKTYRTTKANFKLFVRECRKWIDRYGLRDWEYTFHHEDFLDDVGIQGCSLWEVDSRACRLVLQKTTWNDKPTSDRIRETARHEVRHILLGRLQILSKNRYVSEREIEEEIHAVIMRLGNADE